MGDAIGRAARCGIAAIAIVAENPLAHAGIQFDDRDAGALNRDKHEPWWRRRDGLEAWMRRHRMSLCAVPAP